MFAHWFFMSCVSHSWGEKRFFEFSQSQRPWADLCFHAGWNRFHRVISPGRPQIQLPCIPPHTLPPLPPPPRRVHCSSRHSLLLALSQLLFIWDVQIHTAHLHINESSPPVWPLPFIWLSKLVYSGITGYMEIYIYRPVCWFVGRKQDRKEVYHHPAASVDWVGVAGGGSLFLLWSAQNSLLLWNICFSIYLKNKLCITEGIVDWCLAKIRKRLNKEQQARSPILPQNLLTQWN